MYHMKNTRKKEKNVSAVDIKEAMHKNATTCHCTYPSFFYDGFGSYIYALDDAYLHKIFFCMCGVGRNINVQHKNMPTYS